jgi:DNA-binding response OmpR family regulator
MTQTLAIADDEADLLEALEEYFTAAGFNVIAATNAAAFRKAVEGRHLHAAILDITMPGEDGLSLARWLKPQGPLGLILATALGRPMDRVVGLDIGADDYVVKPYDLRELLARVRMIIRRKTDTERLPDAGVLIGDALAITLRQIGSLTLDDERRALVHASGQRVSLSAAEYDLLDILLSSGGRIVSRQSLVDSGKDADPDVSDRAMDVRIARLRKKIMAVDPASGALLQTVRGEGYRLGPPSWHIPVAP